jgi:hypothetical protein
MLPVVGAYLVRDAESEYLNLMQDEEDAMGAIVGASITYRLAFGPNAGRKALTLQTVPVRTESRKGDDLVSKQAGFSLHAGIACKSNQRKKLERLCRYITRPAIAERRLSLANNGNVVIALKTPYDDGTTHVVLSPMEFMGRLAALVPKPRVNLTRFHGVFSRGGLPPNSKLREYVVPQKPVEEQESAKPKAYSMTWAQRLKRVFVGAAIRIDIEKCERCGGPVRIIASIEDPDVILLRHADMRRQRQHRLQRLAEYGRSP